MQIGRLIANRYEIIEEVGKGGMAIVYKAKCLVLNRYVAIKVLRPEYREDTDFIRRFKVEAQSAGSLSHPNIVSIYDVGQEDDINYIVMEYVEGVTLKQYISAKGRLEWKEAVDYATQVCSGLEHAHKKGIVHKDIKPENVIITKEGILKITDFGIAKVMSTSTIATGGMTMGSVHYFSPEQARGSHTDARTDLYSLGVMLYEMVTGQLPFEGDTAVSVAMQHIEKEPVPPTSLNPSLPASLETVILKAMSKSVDTRYQSATEMLEDLKRVSAGAAVSPQHRETFAAAAAGTQIIPPVHTDEAPPVRRQETVLGEKEPAGKKGKPPKTPEQKKKDRLGVVLGIVAGLVLVALVGVAGYFLLGFGTAEDIECPELLGLTMEEAQDKIANTRLKIEIEREEDDETQDPGVILSQDPEGGEQIKDNATIRVVINAGGEEGTMPNVENRSSDEAQRVLSEMGLRVTVYEESSETVAEGMVTRQSPAVGSAVKSGDAVSIYVSTGPDESDSYTIVPNLIGRTESEARSALERADLNLGEVVTARSSETKGTVVGQSERAGDRVRKNRTVDIQISSGTQSSTGSSDNGSSGNNSGGEDNTPQTTREPATPTREPVQPTETQTPAMPTIEPGNPAAGNE